MFGSLRALALELSRDVHGVDATVTRPEPDSEPIATKGIWITTTTEDVPLGVEFQRREPRRVMALRRADVPTVPRGTLIVAPEKSGDDAVTWRVEGTERMEADHTRVIVIRATDAD
jgi:hypothetical protein